MANPWNQSKEKKSSKESLFSQSLVGTSVRISTKARKFDNFGSRSNFASLRNFLGTDKKGRESSDNLLSEFGSEETMTLENIRRELVSLGLCDKDLEEVMTGIMKKVKSAGPPPIDVDSLKNIKKCFDGRKRFANEKENIKNPSEMFDYMKKDEKNYHSLLYEITENWLIPFTVAFETNRGLILQKKEIQKLFGNIQILEALHKEILKMFEDEKENNNISQTEILKKIFDDQISNMSCYSTFRYNGASSLNILNNIENQSKEFVFYSQKRGIDLKSLLEVPKDRIQLYSEFFKYYSTLISETEKETVLKIIEKLEKLEKECQKYVEETLMTDKMNECQKIISGFPDDELLEPGRRFIKEGDLIILDGPKQTSYHFFLFNDILVWCEQGKKEFKYKNHIDLSNATIQSRSQRFSTRNLDLSGLNVPPKGSPKKIFGRNKPVLQRTNEPSAATDIKNSIQILTPNAITMVNATNLKERQDWLNHLIDVVDYFQSRRVFGIPLVELLKREEVTGMTITEFVPRIVSIMFNFLEKQENIETEGIFRISTNLSLLETYKNEINRGNPVEFKGANPYLVAHLLKVYFRELPEPLFTYKLYGKFTSAVQKEDDSELKKTLLNLPEPHFELLRHLINFIRKVSDYSDKNKMTIHNLCLMIEPNCLKKKNAHIGSNIDINSLTSSGVLEYLSKNPTLFDVQILEKEE